MPHNKENYNKSPGARVRQVRTDNKMTQEKFAEEIGLASANHVSMIERGKRSLTREKAVKIAELFPPVRVEWLMCIDDFKTPADFSNAYVKRTAAVNDSCLVMLESSLREVCLREKIPIPKLDNIPELLFLAAQLKDFCNSLMWNYVKWKPNSHVWAFLEHANECKMEDENG